MKESLTTAKLQRPSISCCCSSGPVPMNWIHQTVLLGRTDGFRILLTLAVSVSVPIHMHLTHSHTDGQNPLVLSLPHPLLHTGVPWGPVVLTKCNVAQRASSVNSPRISPHPGPLPPCAYSPTPACCTVYSSTSLNHVSSCNLV